MRITDSATAISNYHQLQVQKQTQDRLQQQLSTGKRVNQESDDPIAAYEIQDLRRQLSYVEQYKKNASRTNSVLSFTDATLNSATDVLFQAAQLGSQGTSSLITASMRQNLADQVRALKSQLVGLANTQYQGEFLFGGTKNTAPPFSVDAVTGVVTYNGNDSVRSVPVAEGMETATGVSGQDAFLTKSDVFAALDNLAAGIAAGDGAAIGTQLGLIETAREAVSESRGVIGYQVQVVDQAQTLLDRTKEQLLARVSGLEDADMGQIVSQLALSETAIRATLYAQGSIAQKSLFDFIG